MGRLQTDGRGWLFTSGLVSGWFKDTLAVDVDVEGVDVFVSPFNGVIVTAGLLPGLLTVSVTLNKIYCKLILFSNLHFVLIEYYLPLIGVLLVTYIFGTAHKDIYSNLLFAEQYKGPRWQSGNTLASHLCGRGLIPVMAVSGKAGSCLPLVGSLQYRTLANCMYWFPLPFQLPIVI